MPSCASCGTEFELTKPNKRFCSKRCKDRERKKRYRQTARGREKQNQYRDRYRRSEKGQEREKEYRKEYEKRPRVRLRKNISKSIRDALRVANSIKNSSMFEKLPYTPLELNEHLEKQFDERMSWDNYGTYWHIDHIIPQAALPYDSMEHPNFAKCWALDNLQPLSAVENMKKGSLHEGQRHYWDKK